MQTSSYSRRIFFNTVIPISFLPFVWASRAHKYNICGVNPVAVVICSKDFVAHQYTTRGYTEVLCSTTHCHLELENTGQGVRGRFFDLGDDVSCFSKFLEFEETADDSSGIRI
jgi:uncharacterized membrane protein